VNAIPYGKVGDRLVAAFVTVTLLLFAVLVGLVVYLLVAQRSYTNQVANQVATSVAAADHRWCTTVELLTATPIGPPANPAQNPSRVATYKLYLDFIALKKAFGC
jgi:hypothetical protein